MEPALLKEGVPIFTAHEKENILKLLLVSGLNCFAVSLLLMILV